MLKSRGTSLRDAFRDADKDDDGFIILSEFRHLMKHLCGKELSVFFLLVQNEVLRCVSDAIDLIVHLYHLPSLATTTISQW